MNMTVAWLIAFIIMILLELSSTALTTIWFAGGCLVSAVCAVFGAPLWLQITLFFVISLLLLWFTRPIAVKYFNKARIRTNIEGMIGQQAIVLKEICNIEGVGVIRVGGQEWSARSVREDENIPIGTVVVVRDVNGVKLIVEPK